MKIRGENKEELSKFLSTIGELNYIQLTEFSKEEINRLMNRSKVEFEEREQALTAQKDLINQKATERASKDRSRKKTTHIRVNLTHLDNLMNLIGELVINKGRLMVIADRVKDATPEPASPAPGAFFFHAVSRPDGRSRPPASRPARSRNAP